MANDDWRDWFRDNFDPNRFAHPNSPAGGTGTGVSRPPGPQQYWSSSRVPHPDSPAGRHFDWQSELFRVEHQEHQGLTRQIEELEHFLAKQSAIFRENLPDPSLKDIYDRQTGRTKTAGFSKSIDDHVALGIAHQLNAMLQPLENHIQWFDANSRDLPQWHELRNLLGTKQIAWKHGAVEEKRELLNQVRHFAERFYETATKNISKRWIEAKRSGKQEELIERWKRQMLQPRLASSRSGIGQSRSEVEERQQSITRPERRSESPPLRPTAVKTWIEFQLIDEDGTPVPNVSYRVKLTDGSIRNGSLDGQGSVRFDNIDPGQCEITFPEIDAKEWHPIK